MTDMKPGRFTVVRGRAPARTKYFIFEPLLELGQGQGDTMTDTYVERTYPADDWTPEDRMRFWNAYLDERTGTYEFRCRRYDAVITCLRNMGMRRADTIADIGAGRMEFAQRLRENGHVGMYVPIDGCIDGTDLNTWEPPDHVDWCVAIETIEHVHHPDALLTKMKVMARFGLAFTTPNAAAVDVYALDPTHVAALDVPTLAKWGYETTAVSMFTPDRYDTILGWFDRKSIVRQQVSAAD